MNEVYCYPPEPTTTRRRKSGVKRGIMFGWMNSLESNKRVRDPKSSTWLEEHIQRVGVAIRNAGKVLDEARLKGRFAQRQCQLSGRQS